MENLLLITTLGMLTTWLVGLAAKANDWMRHFQANTVRNKAVLSTLFVGGRVLRNSRLLPSEDDIQNATLHLPELIYGVTTQTGFVGISQRSTLLCRLRLMPKGRPRVKTPIMTLRVDPEIKAAAEIAAAQDRRSLTNLVEMLLVNHCKTLSL